MVQEKYVDINNVRDEAMRQKWQRIIDDKVDPFAREHVEKYIEGIIIFETNHWYVFKNDHSYVGKKHQLVIVTQQFFTDLQDLPNDVWIDLKEVKKILSEKFDITGGGFVIRFGDTSISGGSVMHLHAQLIVPEENKQVAAWFGSQEK